MNVKTFLIALAMLIISPSAFALDWKPNESTPMARYHDVLYKLNPDSDRVMVCHDYSGPELELIVFFADNTLLDHLPVAGLNTKWGQYSALPFTNSYGHNGFRLNNLVASMYRISFPNEDGYSPIIAHELMTFVDIQAKRFCRVYSSERGFSVFIPSTLPKAVE